MSSADFSHLPYRPCVGLALFNNQGNVFVGERCDNPGSWQMPQGGVDDGENLETALWRELYEEVGIGPDHAQIIAIKPDPLCYDLPAERIPGFWNGRFRGQSQRWAALRFTGKESDIALEEHHEPEFLDWRWVPPYEALHLIVPFKKALYTEVFEWAEPLL